MNKSPTAVLCNSRKQQKSYYLPIALARAVAREAERGGESASQLVTRILAHYLAAGGGMVFIPLVGTLDEHTDLSELLE